MSDITFKGGPVLTLDGKGRLTVPARFKDVLMSQEQGQMVVAKNIGRHKCLQLFPRSVWDRLEQQLMAFPESHSELKRRVLGSAQDAVIDSASRINIPPELREWAGLDRDVIFMGMGRFFELWSKARFDEHEAAAFSDGAAAQALASQWADVRIA